MYVSQIIKISKGYKIMKIFMKCKATGIVYKSEGIDLQDAQQRLSRTLRIRLAFIQDEHYFELLT